MFCPTVIRLCLTVDWGLCTRNTRTKEQSRDILMALIYTELHRVRRSLEQRFHQSFPVAAECGRTSSAGLVGEPMDDRWDARAISVRWPLHCAWFPWRLRGARILPGSWAGRPEADVHTGQGLEDYQYQRARMIKSCSVVGHIVTKMPAFGNKSSLILEVLLKKKKKKSFFVYLSACLVAYGSLSLPPSFPLSLLVRKWPYWLTVR